ncbi:CUE domain-containing protein 2-A-like isoform X2 [Oratosquilla oratoria]
MVNETEMVRAALEELIRAHATDADMSGIDEIVVSYVTGVIEEVVGGDEEMDAAGMKDVMTAYVPDFEAVPETAVHSWVFDMVHKIQEEKNKDKPVKVSFDTLVSALPGTQKTHNSSSTSETSERSHKLSETSDRSHKLSETSLGSDEDSNSTVEHNEYSDGIALLLEMFPTTCNLEVQHCLATCGGDLEEATGLILQRQEQGISIKPSSSSKLGISLKTAPVVDEKKMKESILNRYGFIDNEDDRREHRPVAPKWEGKKMVRYRDSKVVSLKGERYTEIKKEESEDMKKTYVNLKPGKQYKFH